MKNYILIVSMIMMASLTSCFEERDEDYTMVGAVASIPVLTLSKSNPVVGEQITVSLRYYSDNVKVSQLRLTETIGAGTASVVQSKDITGFDLKNSYTDSFIYTVPSVLVGTKIIVTVEVETENELVNTKFSTITVN